MIERLLQTRETDAGPSPDRQRIESPMRAHCLHRNACKAVKPTTHCRSCAAARLHADPSIEAKRRAAVAAYHADPAVKAELAGRIVINAAKAMERPGQREKMREHGRRQAREYLHRPDIRARSQSPEARAEAGRKTSEKALSWCPPHLRDEYRKMIISKRIPADQARRMIEEQIPGTEAHGRLAFENARVAMRLKHEREVAGRY